MIENIIKILSYNSKVMIKNIIKILKNNSDDWKYYKNFKKQQWWLKIL